MLNPADSRNFSRTFAGLALVLGPVLLLVATLVDPAWGADRAAYLDAVAAGASAYQAAALLLLLGVIFTVVGLLGVIHLVRGRRVNLAQVGAGLLVGGLVVIAGVYPINVIEATATRPGFDRAQMSELLAQSESSPWAIAFPVAFLGGFLLGSVLLAAGLVLQRGIVPLWVPVVLLASMVVSFLDDSQLFAAIGSVGMAAAFAGLARLILACSDEQWARWEIAPGGRRAADPVAPQPTDPTGPALA